MGTDDLRAALEWYADPENYVEGRAFIFAVESSVMRDKGGRARHTLARHPAPDAGERVMAWWRKQAEIGPNLRVGIPGDMYEATRRFALDGDADARPETVWPRATLTGVEDEQFRNGLEDVLEIVAGTTAACHGCAAAERHIHAALGFPDAPPMVPCRCGHHADQHHQFGRRVCLAEVCSCYGYHPAPPRPGGEGEERR